MFALDSLFVSLSPRRFVFKMTHRKHHHTINGFWPHTVVNDIWYSSLLGWGCHWIRLCLWWKKRFIWSQQSPRNKQRLTARHDADEKCTSDAVEESQRSATERRWIFIYHFVYFVVPYWLIWAVGHYVLQQGANCNKFTFFRAYGLSNQKSTNSYSRLLIG